VIAGAFAAGCGDDEAGDGVTTGESSAGDQSPCLMEIAGGRVGIELGSSGLSCEDAKAIYADYTVWLAREYTPDGSSSSSFGEWECYSNRDFSPKEKLAGCSNGYQEFVVWPKPPPSSGK
jgi:hypothetical protein